MKHALPNCPFLFFSFQKYNFRAEKARYLLDRLRGPEVKLNFKFEVSPLYLCKGIKKKKCRKEDRYETSVKLSMYRVIIKVLNTDVLHTRAEQKTFLIKLQDHAADLQGVH